jgi:hypothetical protein
VRSDKSNAHPLTERIDEKKANTTYGDAISGGYESADHFA